MLPVFSFSFSITDYLELKLYAIIGFFNNFIRCFGQSIFSASFPCSFISFSSTSSSVLLSASGSFIAALTFAFTKQRGGNKTHHQFWPRPSPMVIFLRRCIRHSAVLCYRNPWSETQICQEKHPHHTHILCFLHSIPGNSLNLI